MQKVTVNISFFILTRFVVEAIQSNNSFVLHSIKPKNVISQKVIKKCDICSRSASYKLFLFFNFIVKYNLLLYFVLPSILFSATSLQGGQRAGPATDQNPWFRDELSVLLKDTSSW